MKYELVNELINKNFPHSKSWVNGGDYFTDQDGNDVPTLEDLIEACGDGFWTLVNSKMLEGTVWLASQYVLGDEIKAQGTSPQEAIANLWLAFNKN